MSNSSSALSPPPPPTFEVCCTGTVWVDGADGYCTEASSLGRYTSVRAAMDAVLLSLARRGLLERAHWYGGYPTTPRSPPRRTVMVCDAQVPTAQLLPTAVELLAYELVPAVKK